MKIVEHAQPLVLWHIAGNRCGIDAIATQQQLDIFGSAPGIHEYHAAPWIHLFKQSYKQTRLLINNLREMTQADALGLYRAAL